jgi:hypothetical protein
MCAVLSVLPFLAAALCAPWGVAAEGGFGDLIAYIGEDLNVWLISSDGTGAQQITFDAEVGQSRYQPVVSYGSLAWSPDGRRLYFVQRSQVEGAAFVHDLRSGSTERIVEIERDVLSLGVSPNGTLLAHVYSIPADDDCIYMEGECLATLDLRTGAVNTLVCDTCGVITEPDFAPDGRTIAVVWAYHETFGIRLYRFEGSEYAALPNWWGCTHPCYGSDSSRLWALCSEEWLGPWGLYSLDVGSGVRAPIQSPVDFRAFDLSPDGRSLVASDGDEIRVVSLDTMEGRALAQGSQPAWQPKALGPDIEEYLTRKSSAIARLEGSSVRILGLPWPIDGFDETAAIDLTEQMAARLAEGSLTPEQVDAYARLTLQEEALAEIFQLYAASSADLAEVVVDIAGIAVGLLFQADSALEACTASGNPFSEACRLLHRQVDTAALSVIQSTGNLVVQLGSDADSRQAYSTAWKRVTDGIMLELDARRSVADILMDTAVKGLLVSLLVEQYVAQVQPILDQGVRSADPAYLGSAPTWPLAGTPEVAAVQMDFLVNQAARQAEAAHFAHERLTHGAELYELAGEVADLATLTPLAALAKGARVIFRVSQLVVDVSAAYANHRAMGCMITNSLRTGPLASDPIQPIVSCFEDAPR